MKEITMQDVRKLRKEFDVYTQTAEQHMFPIIFAADMMMRATMRQYQEKGITDQKDARAMFRSVLRIMGRDFEDYKEEASC